MSYFGENITRMEQEEQRLNSHIFHMGVPFDLPGIVAGETSNPYSSYNSSLPRQTLISHQTSQAQGNGRGIAKEKKFTADKRIKKSRAPPSWEQVSEWY